MSTETPSSAAMPLTSKTSGFAEPLFRGRCLFVGRRCGIDTVSFVNARPCAEIPRAVNLFCRAAQINILCRPGTPPVFHQVFGGMAGRLITRVLT